MLSKAQSAMNKFPLVGKSSDKHNYGAALFAPDGRPSRFNIVAVLLCLLLPWFIFMFVFGCVSFSLHYAQPGLCWFAVACSSLVVCVVFCAVLLDVRRRRQEDRLHEPTWFGFLLVSSMIAWFAGVALGEHNFETNLKYYYDMTSLKGYPSLNPVDVDGTAVADAGRVFFQLGSHLDLQRSANFRNVNTYCVAPVVLGDLHLATYDFWAVGVNCCSNKPGDFHCGEADNEKAAAGMRMIDDTLSPYYRLAVQQAQERYNMTARHPLFFTWMQDPINNLHQYRDRGLKEYLFWVFLFFGINSTAMAMKLMFFLRYTL